MSLAYTERDAVISKDRMYRYVLSRRWRPGKVMGWIGLNPSTANATDDDQTVRRMCAFADREGYGSIDVFNLYALRTTYPSRLGWYRDPVGPDNDQWLALLAVRAALEGTIVVAAWGAHSFAAARAASVCALFGETPLWCLGTCADGSPKHPSRLAASTPLIRFAA